MFHPWNFDVTLFFTDAFTQGNFDGILGLGFPGLDITKGKSPPIFDVMMKAKVLGANQFAFSLSSVPGDGKSKLTIGGYDKTAFSGDLFKVPLSFYQKMFPYWTVDLTDIGINGKSSGICKASLLTKGCIAIVDRLVSKVHGENECFFLLTFLYICFIWKFIVEHLYWLAPPLPWVHGSNKSGKSRKIVATWSLFPPST